MSTLLQVENLTVSFGTPGGGRILAVDGLSFDLQPGRTLGIVGESGSGKSVTSLAVMGLLQKGAARIDGRIRFREDSLLDAPADRLRDLRGNRMAMIFQEPMTSLNPSHRIGDQIAEAVIRHRGWSREAAWAHAVEMLRKVRIPEPEARAADYPHKLSGGMRQRAMIAMALACDPELLIADEPTTALDVTIQAQILNLLQDLRRETGAAVILITHDLGVVAEVVDEVLVMYAGQVVERASVEALFTLPQHPYTLGLLGSIPRLDHRKERLAAISGAVPDMSNPPPGCRFAARCPFADARCRAEAPPLAAIGPDRFSRCWKAPLEELAA
ncbi:MAG: ABC transporter ATP-binding protein [Beijerinckiaceae bacterium]|nr:ABC transporter ATP-binding protein [Beijerinckiaceae bacterium]